MSDTETTLLKNEAVLPAPAQEPEIRGAVLSVPFRLSITIPLSGLKLRSLNELRAGQVFATAFSAGEDVPVRAGGAVLAHGELDDVDGQMAVRLTRLS